MMIVSLNISLTNKYIIEAWKKYRPKEPHANKHTEDPSKGISVNNFVSVLGEKFIKDLLEHIYKNKDYAMLDDNISDISSDDADTIPTKDDIEVPKNELEIINNFLDKFLLSSESSQKNQIDLKLALKALPKRLGVKANDKLKKILKKSALEVRQYAIDLLNFSVIQISLIEFQNDDKDELFNFYDKRSIKRLYKLRSKSKDNGEDINLLKEISKRLYTKLCTVFEMKEQSKTESSQISEYKKHQYNKSESAFEYS